MLRIFLFFLLAAGGFAEKKQTICLNMIVKDERPVILKCLASVKPFIDYWIIVDTGSTDGTQQLIREFMKDIPGELYERSWIGFAHNRGEALELAKNKADYVFFIDADQVFSPSPHFKLHPLTADFYSISIRLTHPDGAIGSSEREFLVNNKLPWKWVGALHEHLQIETAVTQKKMLECAMETDEVSGHRSQDPQKYHKDAAVLKKALETEPDNARYQFFLGVSYELAGENQLALEAFEKYIAMKNCTSDELYRALFQVGVIQERLEKPPSLFLASYKKAYQHCPSRAEPLFFMGNYYIRINDFQKAYAYFKEAAEIPFPTGSSFVEASVYSYASLYNLEICAEILGKTGEAYQYYEKLSFCSEVPVHLQKNVREKCLSLRVVK